MGVATRGRPLAAAGLQQQPLLLKLLLLPLLLLLVAAPAPCAARAPEPPACGSDPALWALTQTLQEDIHFVLQARAEGDEVVLELSARHDGWLGFGIAEFTSGSMIGADIVTVAVTEDQQPIVTDRFVPWQAYPFAPYNGTFRYHAKDKDIETSPSLWPDEDAVQDWTADAATRGDGCLRVIVRRKAETGDRFDRPLDITKAERVVYAFGEGLNVAYHGIHRGSTMLNSGMLPQSPECAEGGCRQVTFSMGGHPIKAQETTYVCRSFTIDQEEGHVIEIHPVIDNTKHVHHILLHICPDDEFFQAHDTAQLCGLGFPEEANQIKGSSPLAGRCSALLYAWAVGGDGIVLPPVAGFPFGPGKIQHLIMEIHYDNPAENEGEVDDTAMRLVFAPETREHDAGVILLGDASAGHAALPPHQNFHERVGACPGECTAAAMPGDIQVFASFLHMHSFGKRIWSERYKDLAGEPDELNYIESWNFGFQQITPVNYTISPGDHIFTHCEFDTTKWEDYAIFGVDSLEEMCMDFIFYYPAVTYLGEDFAVCSGLTSPHGILADEIGNEQAFDVINPYPGLESLNSGTICGGFAALSFDDATNITAGDETFSLPHQRFSPRWNGTAYAKKDYKLGPESPTPSVTAAPTIEGTTAEPTSSPTALVDEDYQTVLTPLGGGYELAYSVVSGALGDADCYLSLKASVPGHRWLAFGLGGGMVNSRVVIGTDDASFANGAPVAEYTIGPVQAKSSISPFTGSSGQVEPGTYSFENGVSTLRVKLSSVAGKAIGLGCEAAPAAQQSSATAIILAFGEDGASVFAQHKSRIATTADFSVVQDSTLAPTPNPTPSSGTPAPTPNPTPSSASRFTLGGLLVLALALAAA